MGGRSGRPWIRDIYAARITSAGFLYWGADGELICNASGIQEDLSMVSDGMGGAILSWTDFRARR